jgi:hypothetical protein
MRKIAVIMLAASAMLSAQVGAHCLTQSTCADLTEQLINEGYDVVLVINEAPAVPQLRTSLLEFKRHDLATLPLEYLMAVQYPVYVVPATIGTPDTKRHNGWVARVLKLC